MALPSDIGVELVVWPAAFTLTPVILAFNWVEGDHEVLGNVQRRDELTVILKTALQCLYARARWQQAFDFRPKCCIVLDALVKFAFPVGLRFMAVYTLMPLVHRRIFTASALLSIGRYATPSRQRRSMKTRMQ